MNRDDSDRVPADPAPGTNQSFPDRREIAGVLEAVRHRAAEYLASLDERPVRSPTNRADAAMRSFARPLPETGDGAVAALSELWEKGLDATVASSGPRCFHFVIGGTTPAALGADWLTSVLDQMAYAWVATPFATELEKLTLDWLGDLFALPADWSAVMTTGATQANLVGLASARQWWGEKHGVDIGERGFAGLPEVPVFASGAIHASARKALAMLGIGRSSVQVLARDDAGRFDLPALGNRLRALQGEPSLVVATAGEVNAGNFDPIAEIADLAAEHGAWLHVDGAFGLFARTVPAIAHLAAGVERAHSVAVDGHKWLNVPYDCGFAFVSDPPLQGRTFAYSAEYLPGPDDPRPNFGSLGPESSRRARALAVWATLRAYGRQGVRAMVERHLALAQRLAQRIREAPDLELLAEPQLNVVCFRWAPPGPGERDLDGWNSRLGEEILEDGRVYAGTTVYRGQVALRPAISNWRTREEDVDLLVDVVRELGARITDAARGTPG